MGSPKNCATSECQTDFFLSSKNFHYNRLSVSLLYLL
jgi:hypothetical protein